MIIAKLDRLSRLLSDVAALVRELFSDERYHLLSLCGMINTHSAAGTMVLMNLANYCQFEREMISERTSEALQHMKSQGVRLGPAPYGYELSEQRDEKGRRILVPLPHEQEVLRKIEGMREGGLKLREIARRLNEAQIPARRDGIWRTQRISIVLECTGHHTVRPTKKPGPRVHLHHDREAATARAKELRAQGFSLSKIGLRLRKERLTPLRGGIWHPAQVAELLRGAPRGDREAAAERASELRSQGMHLREIGIRLATEGFLPKVGRIWHPAQVHALLANEESADRG